VRLFPAEPPPAPSSWRPGAGRGGPARRGDDHGRAGRARHDQRRPGPSGPLPAVRAALADRPPAQQADGHPPDAVPLLPVLRGRRLAEAGRERGVRGAHPDRGGGVHVQPRAPGQHSGSGLPPGGDRRGPARGAGLGDPDLRRLGPRPAAPSLGMPVVADGLFREEPDRWEEACSCSPLSPSCWPGGRPLGGCAGADRRRSRRQRGAAVRGRAPVLFAGAP
jgi:hypothetical protein